MAAPETPHYEVGGWAQPYNQTGWHFYADPDFNSVALCGGSFGYVVRERLIPDTIGEPQPDDCPDCRRKLEGRKANATA